uniref:Uncharacterized protein n=1 Tax=Brassica campestris TaxID=3711 RepID=A0A3P5Z5H5_BRACM|nr:unnamed protein product [Brassica rapa]
MMSSDLVMVLYVQSLKLHRCSIAQVMAQQGRKLLHSAGYKNDNEW